MLSSRRARLARRKSVQTQLDHVYTTRLEVLEPRVVLSSQDVMLQSVYGSDFDGTSPTTPNSIPVSPGQLTFESDPQPFDVSDAELFGRAPSDSFQVSYDDIFQGEDDTCAVASVISAVALTQDATLPGRIAVQTSAPSANPFERTALPSGYAVTLYKAKTSGTGFDPVVINVPFNGTLQPEDLRPADDNEFWPAIFQRAYLELADELGKNYRDSQFALTALTGAGTDRYTVTPTVGLPDAQRIRASLDTGHATVASSLDLPSYLLDTTYGIVHTHSYTVVGIEIPASNDLSQTFVTVRNPWGEDTAWEYFDTNHNGALSWNEWEASQYGIDGWNDGLIRIPWASFTQLFDNYTVSRQAGTPSNHPLKTNNPPVFSPAAIGPFTIHEGQRLETDLNAADPDGKGLVYYLAPGCPGTVNLLSGTYVWSPPAGTVGTYSVTVVAEVSPFERSSLTFQVNVTSGAPTIGSLTSNVNSIGDGGVDLLTLTANNVALPFVDVNESIDQVEFWQDADGNGTFNEDVDRFLGYGQKSGVNYSWSGYIGSVTPGSVKFFTRAGWFSFSDLHYSTVLGKSITITSTPVIPPVATAGSATQITPTTAGVDQSGFAIEADAAGNLRTFWVDQKFVAPNPAFPNIGNFQYALHTRLYDSTGTALGSPQLLVNYPAPTSVYDAEVMPDGSFVIAWVEYVTFNQSNIKGQRYDSAGNTVGSVFTIVNGAAWAQNQTLEIAADASGDLLCVYNKGDYFDEDSMAVSVSSGNVVTRAPWQVNPSSVSEQKNPAVALNASGNGVIVWNDGEAGKIRGRLVSNYGLSNGAPFDVATDSSVFDQLIDVAVDSNGNFIVSWEDSGVQARRFNSTGTPLGNSFRVNTNLAGSRSNGMISISDSGWFVIGWNAYSQDTGASPGSGVYAQLFDPSGAAAGPEFAVPANLQNNQNLAAIYMDGDADATFLWQNSLVSGSGDDISFIRQFSINLAPTFATNPTFTLPENSAVDTVVGSIVATDVDGSAGLTYSIVSGNLDNAFVINSTTGQIRVADEEALNFEDVASYDLVVRVADSGGNSDLANVTVNLTDVNEAPDLLDLVFSLQENSIAGTLVGDAAAAIDQDESDTITYSLLPGGDASLFTIDPSTGQIFVGATATLNFETKPNLSMTLKAQDDAGLFETATVFVNLTNRIEPPAIVPSTEPVAFKKNGGPTALLPDVTLTASEAFSGTALQGAQLVVSINRASKKGRFFDTLTGFDTVSGIGVLLSQEEVGGRTVFTIRLSDTVTVGAVQDYLRALSFSTTGAGLKLTTRLLKVQLIGTDNVAGNLIEQTIAVRKK